MIILLSLAEINALFLPVCLSQDKIFKRKKTHLICYGGIDSVFNWGFIKEFSPKKSKQNNFSFKFNKSYGWLYYLNCVVFFCQIVESTCHNISQHASQLLHQTLLSYKLKYHTKVEQKFVWPYFNFKIKEDYVILKWITFQIYMWILLFCGHH